MAGAGQLRERVRFQRRRPETDRFGNVEREWATLAERWAQIKPMKGSEQIVAGKLEGRAPVEIMVRWDTLLGGGASALTTDDRVVHVATGTAYNVRAIENRDMRRRYLTITAEAGVAT